MMLYKGGIYYMDLYEQYKHNLHSFTIFSLFSGKLFIATTQVLFFSFKGYTFAQIMLVSSITEILLLILEVPSGVAADLLGDKKCILIGMSFIIASNIQAVFSVNFLNAVTYAVLCALGEAMISGADQSFLYNTLSAVGKKEEFKEHIRKINSKKMYFVACVTILSGLLYKVNEYFPFLLTTIFYIMALIAVCNFKEIKDEKAKVDNITMHFKLVMLFLKESKNAIWIFFLGACYTYLFLNQNVLLQQYLMDVNFPIEFLGIVFFGFNLVTAYFSKRGSVFEKYLGKYTKLVFTVLLIFCLVGAGVVRNYYALVLLASCRISVAVINPMMDSAINKEIKNNNTRATILSFYNAFSSLPDSLISPLLGKYIDSAGIFSAYIIFGLSGIIPLIACFVLIMKKIDI